MGEMADMLLEQMWDIEDEYDFTPRNDRECLYCGLGGLHWSIHPDTGKWRLYDSAHRLHSCLAKDSTTPTKALKRRTTMLRRKQVVYVTDRGQEFVVEEMKASHLLNTIAHINKQMQTLADLPGDFQTTNIAKRITLLLESRNLLAQELSNRDPDKDEAYEDENCQDRGFY